MDKPLWRTLRHLREQHPGPPLPIVHRPRFRLAVVTTAGALAALGIGSSMGNLDGSTHQKVIGLCAAAAFAVVSVIAVRSAAGGLDLVVQQRGGVAAGAAIRLIAMMVGYVIVAIVVLGMLAVPVQRLLVGAGVTGVVLGIAAQQSLGNVFAGLVLLLARPFAVGMQIRIRSGSLGGEFIGVVRAMGLTYVSVDTSEGPLKVPNSAVLAAAVGPTSRSDAPPPMPRPSHPWRLSRHGERAGSISASRQASGGNVGRQPSPEPPAGPLP